MDRLPAHPGVMLTLQIAPEFMALAQACPDVTPGQYFATIFNRLLCQGLVELERDEPRTPMTVTFRFPNTGASQP